jgi:trehalose 6-phosphate phosphatase
MSSLSGLLNDRTALFLDFDGTLAELAPRPDAVVVPNDLAPMLERLHQRLGGALAIITGRAQSDIDTMLRPLTLPGAFEHGAVRRTRHGLLAVDCHPDLAPAVTAAQALAARHPGLLVERKRTAMALHYRLAPELEELSVRTIRDAVGHAPGLQLLHGKAVIEVKSAHASKGKAITAFMAEVPFHGRTPLFLGDDVTDEAGFEAVHRLGGAGIKIGPGATQARHHMADPAAVRAWLRSSVQDLSCTP